MVQNQLHSGSAGLTGEVVGDNIFGEDAAVMPVRLMACSYNIGGLIVMRQRQIYTAGIFSGDIQKLISGGMFFFNPCK